MNIIKSIFHLLKFGRTITINGKLVTGKNVTIKKYIRFEGNVEMSHYAIIEDNCELENCIIGSRTIIKKGSVLKNCIIGSDTSIGPYARIRPNSKIGDRVQIGNFVEIKNSFIGSNSKINHLAYVGDTKMGNNVIFGAGSVTCNFDGIKTNKTEIEKNAFIGSGVYIVAPVKIGYESTVGSGSVITSDVESKKLVIARSKQVVIEGWEGPKIK